MIFLGVPPPKLLGLGASQSTVALPLSSCNGGSSDKLEEMLSLGGGESSCSLYSPVKPVKPSLGVAHRALLLPHRRVTSPSWGVWPHSTEGVSEWMREPHAPAVPGVNSHPLLVAFPYSALLRGWD